MSGATETTNCERFTHLLDPSTFDPFALDELNRRGPKYGIVLSEASAAVILSRLSEELTSYRVSSLGYNNRLYFVTAKSGHEFVIKICGRYWKRVKTETEVVGLFLAGKWSLVPVPRILAWDSTGKEFGVEYTVMRRREGIQLKDLWQDLSFEKKLSLTEQLAKLVVRYKSTNLGNSLSQGQIGNFVILGGNQVRSGDTETLDFDIGVTLEGLGPWSSYKSYLRTQMESKMESVRKHKGMESMRLLLPRIERLLERIDSDGNFADSHEFVFTHGDLTLQNVLVTFISNVPTVTAVLDWEWSGMFPEEEEFFCSFDFLDGESDSSNDLSQLKAHFFSILETGGVGTPRTLAHFEQRKDLYDLRENLFPWYVADCDDISEAVQRAVKEVMRLLDKLNI